MHDRIDVLLLLLPRRLLSFLLGFKASGFQTCLWGARSISFLSGRIRCTDSKVRGDIKCGATGRAATVVQECWCRAHTRTCIHT